MRHEDAPHHDPTDAAPVCRAAPRGGAAAAQQRGGAAARVGSVARDADERERCVRDLLGPEVDRWRLRDVRTVALYGGVGDGTCGAFLVKGGGVALLVIASVDAGWDHVSVSTRDRTPTWDEMERVRKLF